MARLPSHVVATITARIPYGQDGIWQSIRSLGTFTVSDLVERVTADRRTITGYLDRLEKGGYIARLDAGHWELRTDDPETPRLRRDGSPAQPVGRGQDAMWRTMKMLDRFDSTTLAASASLPDCPIAETTAMRYLRLLCAAGYLLIEQTPRPGFKGKTVYALDPGRNTGPNAPQIQATDCVFDPNTREVHDVAGAARRVA